MPELDGEKNPRAKVPSSEVMVLPTESGLSGRRRLPDDAQNGNNQNDQQTRQMIVCMGGGSIAVANYGTGIMEAKQWISCLWTMQIRTPGRGRASEAFYLRCFSHRKLMGKWEPWKESRRDIY